MSASQELQDNIHLFHRTVANSILMMVVDSPLPNGVIKRDYYATLFKVIIQTITGIRPWTPSFSADTVVQQLTAVIGDNAASVDLKGDLIYACSSALMTSFTASEIKQLAEGHKAGRKAALSLLKLKVTDSLYTTESTVDSFELAIGVMNQLRLETLHEIVNASNGLLTTYYPIEAPTQLASV